MKRRLDSNVRLKIMRCFAAIGRRMPTLSPDLGHFHCERWRNATISPFFLSPRGNLKSQLGRAESYFRSHGPKHPYDASGAYVNLLGIDSGDRDHGLLAAARGLGWTVDPRPSTLNAWSRQRPMVLPKSFHLVVGRYFDRTVYRGFRETMVGNFGAKPKFMRELNAMIRGIDERVRTVLLYHESGKIAGGGLVATSGDGAFLFGGSVGKAYRGKGLWNVLVSARQMASAQQGAEFWIATTRTKRLLGKGEFSFPMAVLTK
jgi:hypothetical protein